MQNIDDHFTTALLDRSAGDDRALDSGDPELDGRLVRLFAAQLESRHLDFAARWLQTHGRGYYTIGSAGHEGNAAVGMLSRPTDPALLHYRSGGFYAARAAGRTSDPVGDILASLTAATSDVASGGRHKVFGDARIGIIPQTSTIASHLPRAVGLAFAIALTRHVETSSPWPADSVVICSFGDASANHSTALGALNLAAYLTQRRLSCPILIVCEDNRIGISTRSPDGWPEAILTTLPGIPYSFCDSVDPVELLATVGQALRRVRQSRQPVVLHLRAARFMGHAGSDAEIAYRSHKEILSDFERDPLLATARALIDRRVRTTDEILDEYESVRSSVMSRARDACSLPTLTTRADVMSPLLLRPPSATTRHRWASMEDRAAALDTTPSTPMTLARAINLTLDEILTEHTNTLVFGEDVAVKGGVYGVTRGLRKRFGGHRVFDTLLDEQSILGIALGSALAGFLPIPEIQYLAYLHNAEDQIRGEAASLRFFSNRQYGNGMVVRIAGLAYQRGFGGHFHNDNSVAVLRDIPGLVLTVPSHPADAPGLLRACVEMAESDGRVCVFLEPIARYHTRDLHADRDGLWTTAWDAPAAVPSRIRPGEIASYGQGVDLLVLTFGNGLYLSLQAVPELRARGIGATVVDIRWLSPLPYGAILAAVAEFDRVLVVDETRCSGGVGESLLAALARHRYPGSLAGVSSADSFIPLGPAADVVLLSRDDIVEAATTLVEAPVPFPRRTAR